MGMVQPGNKTIPGNSKMANSFLWSAAADVEEAAVAVVAADVVDCVKDWLLVVVDPAEVVAVIAAVVEDHVRLVETESFMVAFSEGKDTDPPRPPAGWHRCGRPSLAPPSLPPSFLPRPLRDH